MITRTIHIPVQKIKLKAELSIPNEPKGLIIFAHTGGKSHIVIGYHKICNKLLEKDFATLLLPLVTTLPEDQSNKVQDVEFLAQRLSLSVQWLVRQEFYKNWNIGFLSTGIGSAVSLIAATYLGPSTIKAVISFGGQPELADNSLSFVEVPALLMVGDEVNNRLKQNKIALKKLKGPKELVVIPGASRDFDKDSDLHQVIELTTRWFLKYLYWPQAEVDKDFID